MARTQSRGAPSPAERKRLVTMMFNEKVWLLEEWSNAGVPAGLEKTVPRTLNALRGWTGPDDRFGTWSDRNIGKEDHPDPDYRALAKRWKKALSNIDTRLKAKRNRVGELKADKEVLDNNVKSLAVQNAKLINLIDDHHRHIQLLTDTLTSHGITPPIWTGLDPRKKDKQ